MTGWFSATRYRIQTLASASGRTLRVGISVAEGEDRIFIGRGPNGYYRGPEEPFLGLAVMRDGEVVHNLNALEGN